MRIIRIPITPKARFIGRSPGSFFIHRRCTSLQSAPPPPSHSIFVRKAQPCFKNACFGRYRFVKMPHRGVLTCSPLIEHSSQIRMGGASNTKKASLSTCFVLEAPPRIELGIEVLQTCALPLGHGALWSGLRGSNPPPRPWQGRALPNELNPHFVVPPIGIEPTTRGFSVPCSTN